MSRTPLMAGNWKMNLDHIEATHLVQKLDWSLQDAKHDYGSVEVAVCPPFTDIRTVQSLVDGDKMSIKYGAQDLSVHDSGAYTGEISGAFLAKLGCTYVIVGHSERREYHDESDAVVADKLIAAYRYGLTPIFCCGEGLEVRKAGNQVAHVLDQVRAGLSQLTPEQVRSVVIAYEPIWAIGTGRTATSEQANETIAVIRDAVKKLYGDAVAQTVRIQYGGSMNPKNAAELMGMPNIDGGLIGGASLKALDFSQVVCFDAQTEGAKS